MESICKGRILTGSLGKRIFAKRQMLLASKNFTKVLMVLEKATEVKGHW